MSHGPIYLWQLIYQAKTDVVNRGAPETVSVDRWLQPLSLPTPPKAGLHVSQQQFQPYDETARFPEIVSEDRWHAPWSEPVRTRALATAQQQALALTEAAPFAETVTESRWHQPWSEPVRQKPGIAATEHPLVSFDPFPFVSFSWFNRLSEPVRQALRLIAGANQYEAFSESARFPEIVSEDRWHQPWSEPVRRATNAALQSTTAFTAVTSTASVDGWVTAFADPPKPKPGLSASQQQFLALAEAAPFAETVSDDRFHQAWAEPVRTKPGLLVGQQQALAFVSVVTTTPSVDGWATAFADVPKAKPGLLAAEQHALAFVKAAPFAETVSEDRWHAPWSEPVRLKPAAQQQQATAFDPAVFVASVDGWWSPFAEVPKPKAGTTAACQQFFAFDPAVFVAAPDAWAQPWSEPPKPKVSLNVAAQQSLATGYFTPAAVVAPLGGWAQWTDPIQISTKWTTGDNSYGFTAQTVQVSEDRWHQPWSEPVRVQPRVSADAFGSPPNFTTPVAPSFGYFSAFAEPQRQLAGLGARYQQDAAYGFVPIVPPFIFFFGNEEPLPWPGFRVNQFIRENYDQLAFPPFPIPNPPQTQAKFTVSGPSVSDLFPVSGVVYPYAPETRKTVP